MSLDLGTWLKMSECLQLKVLDAEEWLFDKQFQEQLELLGKENGIITRQKQVYSTQPCSACHHGCIFLTGYTFIPMELWFCHALGELKCQPRHCQGSQLTVPLT